MPGIVQIAYFVSDIRASALDMVKQFGAGPFFVASRIELAEGQHRGEPRKFLHSSAYGQWGDIMLELVQQDDEGPSPFRDMYAPGEQGIHHGAIFVDSIEETISDYQHRGLHLASRAKTLQGGIEFAFIDTRKMLGHMLEVYEPIDLLTDFYQMVKTASINWDGKDPIRE